MSDTVKVRIKKGYTGHYHAGELCEPGQVIEVTPRQAAFLHKLGATEPVTEEKKSRSRRSRAKEEEKDQPAESDNTVTEEGAEETPEE